MSKTAFIGRYLPGGSIVHRLDPRIKVILSLAFVAIVLISDSWIGLGVCLAFTVAFFAMARISIAKALRSIAPMIAVVALAALMNILFVQGGEVYFHWWILSISEEGVDRAMFMSARLIMLLLGVSLLTLTTANIDIAEAFERLFLPLSRIGLPVHELSMMMGLALRFLPQLVDELKSIYRAQVSRGARFTANPFKGGISSLSSLIVPLFASAFRHADALSVAMEARCYHGGVGRTRLHPLRLAPRDGVACAVMMGMLACVVVSRLIGSGM